MDGGEGRLGHRHAALAFEGLQEGRLLAADEGARAQADIQVEVDARAQDVRPEQAVLLGLLDRYLQALDGERILGADVDIALLGPDGIAADGHRLDEGVGVALDRGAVHVRAGVALVGVAYDVFHFSGSLAREVPLEPGRESCASAAAEARGLELVHHVGRLHLEERPLEAGIAVASDVFFDILRVDHAAVAQYDAELLLVELDVLDLDRIEGLGVLLVKQALDLAPLHHLLGDDLLGVLGPHLDVEGLLREDLHDRPLLAEAEAAGLDDLDVVLDALRLGFMDEGFVYAHCVTRTRSPYRRRRG